LQDGRYSVEPGLHEFGKDLGNGDADQQVFQFDENFAAYRENKLVTRSERLSKYYRTQMLSSDVSSAVLRFIMERLTAEHPDLFQMTSHSAKNIALRCKLTAETLILDPKIRLIRVERDGPPPTPDYHDALDALACQIQEDIAIISKSPFGRDWLAAVHLCQANNWAAEEKIGQPFQAIHEPVAGMRNSKRDAEAIVKSIVNKGPFLRFAWGLTTDPALNLHPRPFLSSTQSAPGPERFDPKHPSLFLRVERQTLWPFPEQQAALFTIHTYLTDCHEIKQNTEQNDSLVSALKSMTRDQLKYKKLEQNLKPILSWLNRTAGDSRPSTALRSAIHRLYNRR
jgi:hypothetical protein